MSKSLKQMAYDTIEAHQETIADLRTQLAKANEDYKTLFSAFESCQGELKKANERVKELEKRLEPDMFWNSDGDMSFDSLEELFDYYGDCHEGGELVMDCRIGVSLNDKTYMGVYDSDNNEWVIVEQLRKEQDK